MLNLVYRKSLQEYKAMAAEAGIPDYMVDGIYNYVEHGIAPGDFLLAVLRNDLFGAVGSADRVNAKRLKEWAIFLNWCVPSKCWGSTESITNWIKSF